MAESRDKRGHFVKGNVPWNKSVDSSQRRIIFNCQFCGKSKPIEEMRIVGRFSPPLPACRDCWKLLE
jgi:hypothetical protein